MSNVHQLTPEDHRVWMCGCGNCTFVLHVGGRVSCAHCRTELCSDEEPVCCIPKVLQEEQPKAEIDGTNTIKVIELNTSEASLRNFLGNLFDTEAFYVRVTHAGQVKTWGRTYTDKKHKKWLNGKLNEAYRMFTGGKKGA